ncbi:MAG TPA: A/G-specific adenine glycosylase [Planctomycetaceae bacterium]|nr:A/G-specific adenine glycosylase [Planctomycetaceae bacterium]
MLKWHAQHGRDLPWRNQRDAYLVWISEIMLQQTTVAAVKPYFDRFLQRFPTVRELAAADESDVLRLWEGLGYYSRARNLHRAAQVVVEQFGGEFPSEPAVLESLPGVGRYTAGAIASFAYNRRAPIVEANTLRLYCRLLGYDGDPRSTAGQRVLWEFAEKILPATGAGEFNQALTDLGATVCTPSQPDCDHCPAKTCCVAAAEGRQHKLPRPAKRPEITAVTEAYVAVCHEGEYLLRQRTADERWAGLWDFLRYPLEDHAATFALQGLVRDQTGLQIELGPQVAEFQHSVTRYRITLKCHVARRTGGRLTVRETPAEWVAAERFGEYPLSVTGRKLAGVLGAVGS